MRTVDIIIDEQHDGRRMSDLLKGRGLSHGVISELKHGHGILLNGVPVTAAATVHSGDTVTLRFTGESNAVPNDKLQARIVYEDDDVVVFDKPAKMPVHPTKWHYTDTLANLYCALYPELTFRAVSRLDMDTSGLVAIAKNHLSASRLMSDERYRPEKLYYAVTDRGLLDRYGAVGEIIAPIAKEKEGKYRRIISGEGLYARTEYRIVRTNERCCMAEVKLHTGRTHQIRVHFAYLGFPLLGDGMYGGDMSLIHRQALHCGSMKFISPLSGKAVSIVSTLPDDMYSLFG